MRFGNRLANCQSQAESADSLLDVRIDLKKGIEDVTQLFCINSDTSVNELHADVGGSVAPRLDGDPSRCSGEFYGVLDQIPEELRNPAGVGVDEMRLRSKVRVNIETFDKNVVPADFDGVGKAVVKIRCLAQDRKLATVDAGEVKQVINEVDFQIQIAAHDRKDGQILR